MTIHAGTSKAQSLYGLRNVSQADLMGALGVPTETERNAPGGVPLDPDRDKPPFGQAGPDEVQSVRDEAPDVEDEPLRLDSRSRVGRFAGRELGRQRGRRAVDRRGGERVDRGGRVPREVRVIILSGVVL